MHKKSKMTIFLCASAWTKRLHEVDQNDVWLGPPCEWLGPPRVRTSSGQFNHKNDHISSRSWSNCSHDVVNSTTWITSSRSRSNCSYDVFILMTQVMRQRMLAECRQSALNNSVQCTMHAAGMAAAGKTASNCLWQLALRINMLCEERTARSK